MKTFVSIVFCIIIFQQAFLVCSESSKRLKKRLPLPRPIENISPHDQGLDKKRDEEESNYSKIFSIFKARLEAEKESNFPKQDACKNYCAVYRKGIRNSK